MMIFPSTMKPQALLKNQGSAYTFKCDICGTEDQGVYVQPKGDREPWAVLPEEWEEVGRVLLPLGCQRTSDRQTNTDPLTARLGEGMLLF